jgi:hypothetical protein
LTRLVDPVHGLALAVTLLTEATGMALLAGLLKPGENRILRCTLIALGLNLVSHTLFWFGFPLLRTGTMAGLVGAEGVVVLAEAVPYRLLCPFRWGQALAVSLLLNLASFVVGVGVWSFWY